MRIRDERIAALVGMGVVVAAVSMLSGCAYLSHAQETPQFAAVPAMKRAQILNPDAGKNMQVVTGLDGLPGANVNESYAKSFEKKEAAKKATAVFAGLEGLSE